MVPWVSLATVPRPLSQQNTLKSLFSGPNRGITVKQRRLRLDILEAGNTGKTTRLRPRLKLTDYCNQRSGGYKELMEYQHAWKPQIQMVPDGSIQLDVWHIWLIYHNVCNAWTISIVAWGGHKIRILQWIELRLCGCVPLHWFTCGLWHNCWWVHK